MENISVVGIDIAKSVFHAVEMTKTGRVVRRKRLHRDEVLKYVAQLPRCTIAMEACGGAHYWGREFKKLEFEVKLIAPQFVKPYVKSNKNDLADAEAIAEAALRSNMRFCSVKTVEQQEIQHLHRVREKFVKEQTALSNEIRGILMEYGMVLPKGMSHLRRVPELLEKHGEQTTPLVKEMVLGLLEELRHSQAQVLLYEKKISLIAKNHPECRRLQQIRGVGPLIATAALVTLNDPTEYRNGRAASASIGVVPKQESTGGKQRLRGISKRGDAYFRKLLIHGARSVLYRAHLRKDGLSRWVTAVKDRRGWNRAAVALANKNMRIIWALLRYGEDYNEAVAAGRCN